MSTTTKDCQCETCGRKASEHEGCTSCLPATPWEIRLAWLLRAVLGVTVVLLVFQGTWLYAAACVVSILVVALPAAVARTSKANLPVELELILLWFLISDNTLGRLIALYDTTSWFDKALHFGNSLGIGFAGFLVVYVLLFTQRLRLSPLSNAFLILLMTLGIGALWEILEYLLDLMLSHGAQGSPGMTPLDDTMWDLILDGAGGAVGAVLGPLYIERSSRSRCRFSAFAHYFLS